MPRLLVANLDCEQDYAYPRAPRRLPDDVRQRIAAAGTLMAAFGAPGDALRTPLPVDPGRALLAQARGVTLVSGPLPASHEQVLAWGETWAVAGRRGDASGETPETWSPERLAVEVELALWQLRASAESAQAANDRRYAFALNQRAGRLLPGARIVGSVAELEAHLREGGHLAGLVPTPGEDPREHATWVLEAPFAASGRFRLRRRGAALGQAARTRARRLFDTFGQLIFQPWVERLVDVGCVGLIAGQDRWALLGQHVLETDEAGVFRGIAMGVAPDPLAAQALAAQAQLAATVARQLAADGYRGPFGIDGFAFRAAGGDLAVYPMCEINARVTFGLIAHQLRREHGAERASLRLGDGALPASSPDVVPLLAPGERDPGCAWLHVQT